MTTLFTKKSFLLPCNHAVSGVATTPTTVRITQGCVWLTLAGDTHDYWLHAGESLIIPPRRLAVVEAFGSDARVEIDRNHKRLLRWLRTDAPRSMPIARIAAALQ